MSVIGHGLISSWIDRALTTFGSSLVIWMSKKKKKHFAITKSHVNVNQLYLATICLIVHKNTHNSLNNLLFFKIVWKLEKGFINPFTHFNFTIFLLSLKSLILTSHHSNSICIMLSNRLTNCLHMTLWISIWQLVRCCTRFLALDTLWNLVKQPMRWKIHVELYKIRGLQFVSWIHNIQMQLDDGNRIMILQGNFKINLLLNIIDLH